jgi:deazaflavin-dependent oxidoreductase (nitroreductase family)
MNTAQEEIPTTETPTKYNANVITEFRANNGQVGGMWQETPLLLLHHTGAASGVRRVNPVAYLLDESRYLIWAANGGASRSPDWYYNLKANPSTTIEVGRETVGVIAEEATGSERERLFARATDRYPQLAEIARKMERVIPIMVLTREPTPQLEGYEQPQSPWSSGQARKRSRHTSEG